MIADRRMLALDLGTKLGWAAYDPFSPGGAAYAHGRVELIGDHAARFAHGLAAIKTLCRDWLLWRPGAAGRGIMVFETPAARQRSAGLVLYGLRAIALLAAAEWGSDVIEVMPTEIKKLATGRGNASKNDVHEAAVKRWGCVQTEDEADALWALEFARLNAEVTTEAS